MFTTAQPENAFGIYHSPNNLSLAEYRSSTLTSIILPVIYYIVFFVGFVGNGMVVYVMNSLVKRSSKQITDLFVINLAIADLMFLATLPFWATEYLMEDNWIFGRICCKLTSTLTLFSAYGSVLSLSIMAADRLGVVVYSEKYNHYRTAKKATIVILLHWVVSAISSVLALYYRDTETDQQNGHTHCRWNFDRSVTSHKVWYCIHFIVRFVVGFGIPLSVTFVCYVWIFVYLRRRRSTRKLLRRKQDRITSVVLMIITVFILCWTPNQISNLIYVAQGLKFIDFPYSEVQYYVHLFTNTLAWAHSCFNPFLYAFAQDDVRLKFLEITSKCLLCGRNPHKKRGLRTILTKFRSSKG